MKPYIPTLVLSATVFVGGLLAGYGLCALSEKIDWPRR